MRLIAMTCGLLLTSLMAAGCSGGGEVEESPTPSGVTFSSLYGGYFQNCTVCHTPDAPGRTSSTETALDFTSESTALATISEGVATGLSGNEAGCNGVPFVGDSPETSLIVASIDETVRASFSVSGFPDCTAESIADMTLKSGGAPDAQFVTDLKQWIVDYNNGAAARPGEDGVAGH